MSEAAGVGGGKRNGVKPLSADLDLKRRVLAYITKEGKPLSRPEIERGVGKKIRYFGHIVQSLVRKYLILPIPGENKYELTGTGKRVGEIYIELIDKGEDSQ